MTEPEKGQLPDNIERIKEVTLCGVLFDEQGRRWLNLPFDVLPERHVTLAAAAKQGFSHNGGIR
jgi:hypothetical protein